MGELRNPEMEVDEDVLDGRGVPMVLPERVSAQVPFKEHARVNTTCKGW